jgi:integrase
MLTDPKCKKAKPAAKFYRLYDEKGLYLEVRPTGSKYWRLKFRLAGREKRLALGVYPEVSLKEARDNRDAARKQIAAGVDPGAARKAARASAADSFEAIAREWYSKHCPNWSENHSDRIIRRLERDIFPWIGGKPIAAVTAPELLGALRRIENRGAVETAHRALQNCRQIFRYAVATGRAESDPSGDLKGALPPVKETHFSAITEPKQVAGLLRIIDDYHGTLPVKCALKLAPLVFVRPGELRKAQWEHIHLDTAEWRYIVTKTGIQHIVPLSHQAVGILRELRPLTGHGRYVFPSARSPRGDRPMSDNAILGAMRRMGIGKDEMSGHGFRAMARTILDEVLGFRPDYIEHQLAHAVRDPNGRAYNRTAHLPERRKMMQAWADYLDGLRNGADVIPFPAAG